MNIKIKLSILMIAIVAVVAGGIAVIQLRQASSVGMNLSVRGLEYLAREQAMSWKGREETFLNKLGGIADIMGDFEAVRAADRRDTYDRMLLTALNNNPEFVGIFSVWKPNALDGRDVLYIGRTGSTATGQYAMNYSRETGRITASSSLIVNEITAYMNGPDALKDRVENPTPFKVNGKDTFIVRMGVPITRSTTNEVVGHLAILLDIAPMQDVLGDAIKSHEGISAYSIYSQDTTIMAGFIPDSIGKKLADADLQYDSYTEQASKAILKGHEFYCQSYDPLLKETLYMFMIPFNLGNSDTTWSVMIGSTESYILKEVRAMTMFTIILSVMAFVVAVVIIIRVINAVIKPIVKKAAPNA
jgi:methyl-accepting chemotaxis protein